MQQDFAIIVGITRYPYFDSLEAPERDAKAFYEWVRSPEGGDVPEGNITLICSSGYAAADEPSETQVDKAFRKLFLLAQQKNTGVTGRRLYIFLAGHGFAQDLVEASLLMANADKHSYLHIPGRAYAEFFRAAAFFQELVLFADCCRNHVPRAPLKSPPFEREFNPNAKDVKYFYAYATRWSMPALEGLSSGFVQGIFTQKILQGLRVAQGPDGKVTAKTLKEFLEDNEQLRELQPPELHSGGVLQFGPERSLLRFPVRFHLSTQPAAAIKIKDFQLKPISTQLHLEGTSTFRADLPRGIYLASSGDHDSEFQVTGTQEVVDVHL